MCAFRPFASLSDSRTSPLSEPSGWTERCAPARSVLLAWGPRATFDGRKTRWPARLAVGPMTPKQTQIVANGRYDGSWAVHNLNGQAPQRIEPSWTVDAASGGRYVNFPIHPGLYVLTMTKRACGHVTRHPGSNQDGQCRKDARERRPRLDSSRSPLPDYPIPRSSTDGDDRRSTCRARRVGMDRRCR